MRRPSGSGTRPGGWSSAEHERRCGRPPRSGSAIASRRSTAEYLKDRGADVNWVGYDDLTPLDAALRTEAPELVEWLRGMGGVSAADR